MRCPQCGSFLSKHGTACDCGWEKSSGLPALTHSQKAIATYKSFEQSQHESRLWVAEYERRKFQLYPQAPGESDESFCVRIDREKTPTVVERNVEISMDLDSWRSECGLPPGVISPTLKRLFARWLPREPGEDG